MASLVMRLHKRKITTPSNKHADGAMAYDSDFRGGKSRIIM